MVGLSNKYSIFRSLILEPLEKSKMSKRETKTSEQNRNEPQKSEDWQCTTSAGRIALKRQYPHHEMTTGTSRTPSLMNPCPEP